MEPTQAVILGASSDTFAKKSGGNPGPTKEDASTMSLDPVRKAHQVWLSETSGRGRPSDSAMPQSAITLVAQALAVKTKSGGNPGLGEQEESTETLGAIAKSMPRQGSGGNPDSSKEGETENLGAIAKWMPRKAQLKRAADHIWDPVYDKLAEKRFRKKGNKYRLETPTMIAKVSDEGGELLLGGLPMEGDWQSLEKKHFPISIHCYKRDQGNRTIEHRLLKEDARRERIPGALVLQLNTDKPAKHRKNGQTSREQRATPCIKETMPTYIAWQEYTEQALAE